MHFGSEQCRAQIRRAHQRVRPMAATYGQLGNGYVPQAGDRKQMKVHIVVATLFTCCAGNGLTGPKPRRHLAQAQVAKPRTGSRIGDGLVG